MCNTPFFFTICLLYAFQMHVQFWKFLPLSCLPELQVVCNYLKNNNTRGKKKKENAVFQLFSSILNPVLTKQVTFIPSAKNISPCLEMAAILKSNSNHDIDINWVHLALSVYFYSLAPPTLRTPELVRAPWLDFFNLNFC